VLLSWRLPDRFERKASDAHVLGSPLPRAAQPSDAQTRQQPGACCAVVIVCATRARHTCVVPLQESRRNLRLCKRPWQRASGEGSTTEKPEVAESESIFELLSDMAVPAARLRSHTIHHASAAPLRSARRGTEHKPAWHEGQEHCRDRMQMRESWGSCQETKSGCRIHVQPTTQISKSSSARRQFSQKLRGNRKFFEGGIFAHFDVNVGRNWVPANPLRLEPEARLVPSGQDRAPGAMHATCMCTPVWYPALAESLVGSQSGGPRCVFFGRSSVFRWMTGPGESAARIAALAADICPALCRAQPTQNNGAAAASSGAVRPCPSRVPVFQSILTVPVQLRRLLPSPLRAAVLWM
jgi:hypothetical protein